MSAYYVPSTVLAAGDTAVNKIEKAPTLREFTSFSPKNAVLKSAIAAN